MKYEIMLILDPKLTEKEQEKTLKEITGSITEHGFEMKEEDFWGLRDLAYKIKGCSKGNYVVMTFVGEGAGAPGLQKDLRLQLGLLRSMVVKVPDDYVLLRFEQIKMAGAKKLSKSTEELQERVSGKRKPKEEEVKPEINLDEKLKAIAEDAGVEL